jgi:nitrous oxidase accessory protein NosD
MGRYANFCDYVEVVNCVCINNGDPRPRTEGGQYGPGIRLGGQGSYHVKEAYIANNTITDVYEHGIKAYLGVDYIVIENNVITNAYSSGIWNENPGIIRYNTIPSCLGSGMVIGASEGNIIPSPYINIYNNVVRNTGNVADPWAGGIYINPGAQYATVKNNYIADCYEQGIQQLASYVTLEGNAIYRARQYGILNGVTTTYPVSGVKLLRNQIYSCTQGAIRDSGTNTTIVQPSPFSLGITSAPNISIQLDESSYTTPKTIASLLGGVHLLTAPKTVTA